MRKIRLTPTFMQLVILLLMAYSCHRNTAPEKHSICTATFPQDWEGRWSGMLEIHKTTGKSMDVPMQLTISSTQDPRKYHWKIRYGAEDSTDDRPYELLLIDKEAGHYQIDEGNSIAIDGYLFGNRFVTAYEVMGNAIDITYEYKADVLTFDLIMYAADAAQTSGGQVVDGDTIPTVRSYPIKTMQKAVLRRS